MTNSGPQDDAASVAVDAPAHEAQDGLSDGIPNIVEALCSALEAKDFSIRRHSERVARSAAQVAEKMNLTAADCATLRFGALLHDIGNIGIADSLLLKPSGLAEWELEEVRMHPIIGEQICKPLHSLRSLLPLLRSHHEKLNGTGYPDGLAGDAIPLLVRILSVADVYDTLRSDRAYRGAFGHEQAARILQQEVARGWWQADIVALMLEVGAHQGDFAPV